tara:strand:+ start:90792 stop:92045 length:1254 start_codon:yes stop_codon:yes gene_type:complete
MCLSGQNVVRGRIIDGNNEGVSYATIQTGDNQTISNDGGYFELKTNLDTVVLTIRHVSFLTKTDTINILTNDRFISITLIKKEINLDSVTVNEKRYPDFLMDYEISKGVIYTLNRRNKKRFVKTFNPEKSWLIEKEVSKKYNDIKKDCFGNIHLIADDSVRQIFVYNNDIFTIANFSIAEFQKQLEPCVAAFDNRIITSKYANHDQQLILDLYHNKSVTHFANIWDEEATKNAQSYYSEIIRLYYQNTPEEQNIIELGVWDGDLVKLIVPYAIIASNGTILRSGWTTEQIGWYKNVAAKPLYCPVFVLDENLILFDFVNGVLKTYRFDGQLLNSIPISFHKNKGWVEQVLADEATGKLYTIYQLNGAYFISEINTEDGTIKELKPCFSKQYPENIRVYNEKVFYIFDFKLHSVLVDD